MTVDIPPTARRLRHRRPGEQRRYQRHRRDFLREHGRLRRGDVLRDGSGYPTGLAYGSSNPYDRQKAAIGPVGTPMFDPLADHAHLDKTEGLMREWVEFVGPAPAGDRDFQSFHFGARAD